MQSNRIQPKHAAQKKRPAPALVILVALLVVLLLALVAVRLHVWLERRDETRAVVLVNQWNDMDSSGFTPHLKTVEDVEVDASCVRALEQMLADCRAAGGSVTLTAGYRSQEEQLLLFNNEVNRQMAEGFSADLAYTIAEKKVGAPGCDEHALGLAVDIQGAAAQSWLRENSWRYGFILRFPEGSEEITGRSADPSHFRFVGSAAAGQIHNMQITLEEYMEMFFSQEAEIIVEE